jgi:multiple sugar transport system substrate-binding protein
MTRMFKQVSILMLLLAMTASLLVGCGKNTTDGSAASTLQAANQATGTTPGDKTVSEPVTLKFAAFISTKDVNGNYIEQNVIDEFTKKNPNIKVELQMITDNDSEEYVKKTDLMLAGGDDIDLLVYPRLDWCADRARKGMLAPLDEYITAEGKKFSDLFTVDTQVDGKIYSLPNDSTINFVMLNKQYLDEAGLPIPKLDWTWDEYRDYAKKLTKGDGQDKRYGSYMHTWADFKFYGPLNTYTFGPLLKEDGTSNITDPNIKDWLQFRSDLENVDKSQIPYFEAKSSKLAYRDVFFQGKAAMVPIGSWMIGEIATSLDKYPHDWAVAFAPIPKFKDYPAGSTNTGINMTAVTSNSKHKEEAYLFAKFDSEEGVIIRAQGLPCKTTYDLDGLLTKMIAGKDTLYDVPSLKAVLNNPGLKPVMPNNIFPYTGKVSDSIDAEFEKFLVGGEKLDEAIANGDKQVNDIITAAK